MKTMWIINKKIENFLKNAEGFGRELDTKLNEIELRFKSGEKKFFKKLYALDDTLKKVEQRLDKPKKKGEDNEKL